MAKYDIDVKLIGTDGNGFSIIAKVTKALREAGVSKEERDQYFEEATSGDYNKLLCVTQEWVNVL